MANQEQLAILRQGVKAWNEWRETATSQVEIDLSHADLPEMDLRSVNFRSANLTSANLRESNLAEANLEAAILNYACLEKADLQRVNFRKANLYGTILTEAYLWAADFSEANLGHAFLVDANLGSAHLNGASLRHADLARADLFLADLQGADLSGGADLGSAKLNRANLENANLQQANLALADLYQANLRGADLTGAILKSASFLETVVDGAEVSGSSIYGVNIWNVKGEFKEQKDLIIADDDGNFLTVDNIKIAQFLYLILNNREIRNVIDTLTSKSVLILGRFAIPERKAILDALRKKLREYDLLPIVFDFDRPTDKDFTETIKTLAGLSYFVIADVTNPKSSPLELQATVPDYQIPFVPIVQEGERPFAMMVDLQKKYDWVLNTVSYDTMETLLKALKPLIIEPAMQKRQELRRIKAQEPEIISAKDFLAKGER